MPPCGSRAACGRRPSRPEPVVPSRQRSLRSSAGFSVKEGLGSRPLPPVCPSALRTARPQPERRRRTAPEPRGAPLKVGVRCAPTRAHLEEGRWVASLGASCLAVLQGFGREAALASKLWVPQARAAPELC